jgi:hypothetical protein
MYAHLKQCYYIYINRFCLIIIVFAFTEVTTQQEYLSEDYVHWLAADQPDNLPPQNKRLTLDD